MSLDDRFNPNDGSFIDRLDSSLVRVHKKIGEYWQQKTHRPATKLRNILYGTSAAGHGVATVGGSYMCLIPTVYVGLCAALGVSACPPTALESEIQMEAIRLPRKFWKYINFGMFSTGIAGSFIGLLEVTQGILDHNVEKTMKGVYFLGNSVGGFFWASGNYLTQSTFGEPPKKPKKKPLKEKVRDFLDGLLPGPEPYPTPLLVYGSRKLL